MTLFWRLVWLFALASLAGFLLESTESLFSLGYVQNRQGLLFGPFAPVYGAGAVALALAWPLVKHRPWPVALLVAIFLTSGVEYLWSLGQAVLFRSTFWDYSRFQWNLHGRVNLLFSLFWGVLGLAFWRWVWPRFQALWQSPARWWPTLTAFLLALFLAGNSLLSASALIRHAQRREAVSAQTSLQLYLDETWPDDVLSRTFPTMRALPS